MADLTVDDAIKQLKALPPDRQRAILGKLSPDVKKGILAKLNAPTETPAPSFLKNPREFLEWRATELGQEVQGMFNYAVGPESQPKYTPKYDAKGKFIGYDVGATPSVFRRYGTAALAGIPATGEVVTKAARGLLEPKTQVAVAVAPFDPAATAAYFMTGATGELTGLTPGIEPGKTTPENVQNALLAGATVAGGVGAAGEPASGAVLKTPAAIKTQLAETTRNILRGQTGARAAAKDAVIKASEQHAEAMVKNKQQRLDTMRENMKTQYEARQEIDLKKIEVAEKNKAIEAKNKAAEAQVAKRGELQKQVDQQSVQLGQQIEQVEAAVGQEANAKFDRVRQKVGNPSTDPSNLIAAVQNVEHTILQDIPENVKEFRSILSHGGTSEELTQLRSDVMSGQQIPGRYEDLAPERKALVDEIVQKYGGELEANTPITWEKLQSLKSRIDARLRKARTMNGDLKRGLRQVRENIIDEMGKMADAAGAGQEWSEARNFWRQYKEDFHEPTGPSGSGSPVASSFDAADPRNIRAPFLRTESTVGNRGIDILRKYPQFGGTQAADLAQSLLASHKEMTGLPQTARTTALKPTPEAFPLPGRKAGPPVPERPTVDLSQEAREQVALTAQRIGRLNAWDARIIAESAIAGFLVPFIGVKAGALLGASYVITKNVLRSQLENPKVVEWIAKTPQAELDAIMKLPEAQQVQIKAVLAEAVKEGGIRPSPQLQTYLSSGAGAAAHRPRNRKEALQVLGR